MFDFFKVLFYYRQDQLNDEAGSVSEEVLANLYCMAIVRFDRLFHYFYSISFIVKSNFVYGSSNIFVLCFFGRLVNGAVEKTRKKELVSIAVAAEEIGIPRMLIDIRHGKKSYSLFT